MSAKKKVLIFLTMLAVISVASVVGAFFFFSKDLPKLITMQDYKPLLVTEVYSRDGKKVGEFFRERRILTPFSKIPKHVVQAFLAAEDDEFYEHKGINYVAILRATIANIQAGKKVQGGSTITQQVAKTLFLSSERTYDRKIKEFFLAHQMEKNFTKDEILYLYLNQIYFGQGAYGVGTAAKTYFRKDISEITLEEGAILAGLPKAPSAFSPIKNAKRAKERQLYVLGRMKDVGFINKEQQKKAAETPLKVFKNQDFELTAGYYIETIRLLLNDLVGEQAVLDEGLKVYSSLDWKMQRAAEEKTKKGLRDLDKRQGYRGPIKNLSVAADIRKFLVQTRAELFFKHEDFLIIDAKGNVPHQDDLKIFHQKDARGQITSNIPPYISTEQIVEAIVTKVDDALGIVFCQFAEGIGAIDLADMSWARKPDAKTHYYDGNTIKKPSLALKKGDVILVRVLAPKFVSERLIKERSKPVSKKKGAKPTTPNSTLPSFEGFAELALEQEPATEAALLSIDLKTEEILAMVGGYDFEKSKFNRAIQAQRQTGSSFKVFVYASGLEKGFTPASTLIDAPLVFKNQTQEGQGDVETWKPHNYSNSFNGDILFREALKKSVNTPAIKILESVGLDWAILYSQRLGIFSPLNKDLSLVLGSSGVTLYEMTKAFAVFGRLGKKTHPLILHKVTTHAGKEVLKNISLDVRFKNELAKIDQTFQELKKKDDLKPKPSEAEAAAEEASANQNVGATLALNLGSSFFFKDPEQAIRPETAYIMTNILQSVVNEPGGTAGKARVLGRDTAGKTGTTNGYFDAWFMGYTAQIATGVWVGYDEERSMGIGETGGDAALPIWVAYMLEAHKNLSVQSFQVPAGITFANIDLETGELASVKTKDFVRQAFVQGTEPAVKDSKKQSPQEEGDFFKEDMSQ